MDINLYSFLKGSAGSVSFSQDRRSFVLMKVPAPKHPAVMMLYLAGFRPTDVSADSAKYQGLAWFRDEKCFVLLARCHQPEMEKFFIPKDDPNLVIVERLEAFDQATEILRVCIEAGDIPEVSDIDRKAADYPTLNEWVRSYLTQIVRRHFMNRTKPVPMKPIPFTEEATTFDEQCAAIENPSDFADVLVERYIQQHAVDIRHEMETYPLILQKLEEIEQNPSHPYHLRRRIVESIDPAIQSVRVTIERGGVQVESRISVCDIKVFCTSAGISAWSLEKSARDQLGDERIEPEEIVKISYRKKVLYQRV